MSILNVWMERDCALIGTDSECMDSSGTIDQVSKILPLVHIHAVISGVGQHLFFNQLWAGCHCVGGDFDGLIEKLPKILPVVYGSMLQAAKAYGIVFRGDYEKQTAVICGWSEQYQRMRCYSYTQLTEASGFSATEILPEHGWLQPAHPRQSTLPSPCTPEAMKRHACEQVSFIKRSGSGVHAGGKFILARIERDRLTIDSICNLNNEVIG